jgi:hypothetical protein
MHLPPRRLLQTNNAYTSDEGAHVPNADSLPRRANASPPRALLRSVPPNFSAHLRDTADIALLRSSCFSFAGKIACLRKFLDRVTSR